MGIGGGLRPACATVLCVMAMARAVSAEPTIVIACAPSCVASDDPLPGTKVSISIQHGGERAPLAISAGAKAVPCDRPCMITWPGAARVQVRIGRSTMLVAAPAPASVPAIGAAAEPSTKDLLVAGLDLRAQRDRTAIYGDGSPVPSRDASSAQAIRIAATAKPPPAETRPPPAAPGPAAPATTPAAQVGAGAPLGAEGGVVPFLTNPTDVPPPTGALPPDPSADGEPDPNDVYLDDVLLVGSDDHFFCTGIALGARAILTARHCAGATRIGVPRGGGIDALRVRRVAVPGDGAVDVALLWVDRDLGVPIRERAHAPVAAPSGGLVRMVGYGTTDRAGTRGFGLKRQAFVPVVHWACSDRVAAATGCQPSYEVIIASPQVDTCRGDSGGPVLDHDRGHWRLIAVTSRAVPGHGSVCGRGGVYTQVGALDAWIGDQMGGSSR